MYAIPTWYQVKNSLKCPWKLLWDPAATGQVRRGYKKAAATLTDVIK